MDKVEVIALRNYNERIGDAMVHRDFGDKFEMPEKEAKKAAKRGRVKIVKPAKSGKKEA